MVSVPAPESGRVARRGGRRARRGARSPNRRKPFPARVAVFSRRSRKSGPDGAAAHARKRPGRFRFEALERVDRRTRTRGRRGRRSFARRGPRGIRTAAHRTLGIFSNSCGCSDGIDFTERVRSGYPGSAHRRARTRPSGDVRGETASATTLDARGRRSRGAGFDPRVTPNAMTSPREPLHFSSRSSISTKWIRLSVRALPPRMGIQSRRARFGLPVRARLLHSLAPKNANSGAYAQLVSPESKIGSRRISDLLADQ